MRLSGIARPGFAVEKLSGPANLSATLSDAVRTDSAYFLLGLDALADNVATEREARSIVPR